MSDKPRPFFPLRLKISLMFTILVVVSVGVTTILSLERSAAALLRSRFDQLETVRTIKSRQVTNYFAARRNDMNVLVETVAALKGKAEVALYGLHQSTAERIASDLDAAGAVASDNTAVVDRLERLLHETATPTASSVRNFVLSPAATDVPETFPVDAIAGQSGSGIYSNPAGAPMVYVYSTVVHPSRAVLLVTEQPLFDTFGPNGEAAEPDFFRLFADSYGYHDLFLVDRGGTVFYSVLREPDYQTNLFAGPYSDSSLADAVRSAMADKGVAFADYRSYAPSDGEPAAFIAQPVPGEGAVELVAALQMPSDPVNAIMQERTGMGETGETYLVGPDGLMRSDSYLDPANRSIRASFAGPSTGRVDTQASRLALSGVTDSRIVVDYNGNTVLSAFAPVRVYDTTWAILSEIDLREVRSPIRWLRAYIFIVTAGMLVGAIAGAVWFADSVSKPILLLVAGADKLAKGSIAPFTMAPARLAGLGRRHDEIGLIAESFQNVVAYQMEKVRIARQIADGNLDVDVRLSSDEDVLGRAMSQMLDARRAHEHELEYQRGELERLARHLQRAREEQTAYIAREVHDDLGQSLSSMEMHLTILEDALGNGCCGDGLRSAEALRTILGTTIEKTRRLVEELRPTVLLQLGLGEALRQLVEQYNHAGEPAVELTMEPGPDMYAGSIDDERALAVYRIVQEAVTNAIKHAKARTVFIAVQRTDGGLSVEVRDDGTGFDPAATSHSHGLIGIRERAMSYGGRLDLSSSVGSGTVLRVYLPTGVTS